MFNLRQLRSFVYVAQQNSFTKAAKILYMTQPAISAQIKSLEERLDVKLMERNDRHVILTEAGEIFLAEAEKILASYDRIIESINELKGIQRGHIKIAASTIPGEYILPRFIGYFKDKYPKVDVELNITDTEQVVDLLRERAVDIGITGAKLKSDVIGYEKLLEDELIIIAPFNSEIAEKENPNWSDLLSEQFILREIGSGTRSVMMKKLNDVSINTKDIKVAMEIGSTRAVITAVESGLGVSIISKWAARQTLKLGLVKEILINDWNPKRPLFIAWNTHKYQNHITEVFLNELREYPFEEII